VSPVWPTADALPNGQRGGLPGNCGVPVPSAGNARLLRPVPASCINAGRAAAKVLRPVIEKISDLSAGGTQIFFEGLTCCSVPLPQRLVIEYETILHGVPRGRIRTPALRKGALFRSASVNDPWETIGSLMQRGSE
jgi:hypothetical protein